LLAAVALGSIVPAVVGTGMADLVGIRAPSLRFHALWVESMSELGAVCVAWIVLAHRDGTRAALRQAEVDRITTERQLTEARLGALQAQIEPHFLFNTLANVRWLLRTNRPAGRVMIQRLSRYLESSLPTLRDTRSTLGRELALTSAYLDVQRIRMGSRLRSSVDVPGPLHAAVFPPLMLMTLVENAIKHGLASLPDGGQVAVTAEARDGRLRVQVRDTGTGFRQNAGKGIGIANTRARLSALYGDHARLSLAAGAEGGVIATIELPLEHDGQRAA
jgi:LytS/YehU family sensor histidine kinase